MAKKKVIPTEEVASIISEELEPVVKKTEDLQQGYETLLKEHIMKEAESKQSLEELQARVTELETALTDAQTKAQELVDVLAAVTAQKEELEAKVAEGEKAAEEVPAEVEQAVEEARAAFVKEASEKLEKHVNEVTSAAFNSTRTLFEADFAPIETNVLQELGRTLAPYIADPELPSKIENLTKALNETKQSKEALKKEAVEAIKKLDETNKQLKQKLVDVATKYNTTKIQEYKESLISKLPERSRETARQQLAEVNTIPDIKRIYLAVIRESASNMGKAPETKPVAAKGGKALTEATKPGVKETPVKVSEKLNTIDSDVVPFDDEMKKRAGVL